MKAARYVLGFMKSITFVLLFVFSVMSSGVYGGQPPAQGPRGVAGVDVFLKQNPKKRVTTDANGNFALDALPAGSHVLTFRARKANESPSTTASNVVVATSYSIKIDGTRRAVNQSGLTSDKLTAGVDVAVEVGGGSKVRGQVLAASTKKMVWIAQEVGSNIPGHWVDADSKEASNSNRQRIRRDDFIQKQLAPDPHQEGFGGR